jgi:alkanesulfonate monooxygenase SsuD/methylene tetrahydromethanopterin reductase-like flavin-dependent oxidoreductase (luciferase family)
MPFPFTDRLRFGIHAGQQYSDFPAYLELWRTAEDLGLDWASVFDHFLPIQADPTGPCFEGLTLLAAMAAHTQRLRCGIVVVGVTYRSPAVLAKMAATIDHISGGRLQYGIPFPPLGQRLGMMGEAAEILKSLWTQETTTFSGRHYQLSGARAEPKPLQSPSIPLWIGGAGERVTLRHVAAHADGWNTFLMPMEDYQRKLCALDDHCADVGRDRSEIRLQLVLQAVLGTNAAEIEDQLRARAEGLRVEVDALRGSVLAMTPQQLVEHLRPYVEVGVGDFLLLARPPMDRRTLELFAGEVAPALRD